MFQACASEEAVTVMRRAGLQLVDMVRILIPIVLSFKIKFEFILLCTIKYFDRNFSTGISVSVSWRKLVNFTHQPLYHRWNNP
jgi:hypothetical protein